MRLGWNQREILWRFMVNTRRSGRIFARIRKRRPFILTASAEGGPTRKHLDLSLSEEFILLMNCRSFFKMNSRILWTCSRRKGLRELRRGRQFEVLRNEKVPNRECAVRVGRSCVSCGGRHHLTVDYGSVVGGWHTRIKLELISLMTELQSAE